jgi:hypothetical protein
MVRTYMNDCIAIGVTLLSDGDNETTELRISYFLKALSSRKMTKMQGSPVTSYSYRVTIMMALVMSTLGVKTMMGQTLASRMRREQR